MILLSLIVNLKTLLKMCTKPVKVTRRDACSNSVRTYYVPCGKCADCVKKKQAEFSALALHQGLKSGSLHFFTFTYNNGSIPVAITEDPFDDDNRHIIGFERGCSDWLGSDGSFLNRVLFNRYTDSAEYERCCSLKREDVKLVLKQFRRYNPGLKFKYAIFGEYGEDRGRPHYHGLFFGLTDEQAKRLSDLWASRFGFVHYAPHLSGNLSLDDYKAMSLYVSKYISKGNFTRWKHILPYVEAPRRQSSLDFGSFSKEELSLLANFMMGAIRLDAFQSITEPDMQMMLSWLWSVLDANLLK